MKFKLLSFRGDIDENKVEMTISNFLSRGYYLQHMSLSHDAGSYGEFFFIALYFEETTSNSVKLDEITESLQKLNNTMNNLLSHFTRDTPDPILNEVKELKSIQKNHGVILWLPTVTDISPSA